MGTASRSANDAPARSSKQNIPIDHVPSPEDDGDSKFARALGSGDFHTRDKGVKALTLWLQRQKTVSEHAFKKLWRGIFYCFWHSDKAHVQEDLAKRLAAIFPQLNEEVAEGYFAAFLDTMQSEWARIDRLRLDKFMMLVRKFLEQLLTCMAARDWDKDYVTENMRLLHASVFEHDDALLPAGFALHVSDIFLQELLRVSSATGRPIPAKLASAFLIPFVATLATSRQQALIHRIRSSVFEALANELSHPSEGAPMQAVKPNMVAKLLFAAGGKEGVRHRNRAALYELSQRFEHIDKKRKRSAVIADDADNSHPEASEASAKRQKHNPDPASIPSKRKGKNKKGKLIMPAQEQEMLQVESIGAADAGESVKQARAAEHAVLPEVAAEPPEAGAALLSGKQKRKKRQSLPAGKSGVQPAEAKEQRDRKSMPVAVAQENDPATSLKPVTEPLTEVQPLGEGLGSSNGVQLTSAATQPKTPSTHGKVGRQKKAQAGKGLGEGIDVLQRDAVGSEQPPIDDATQATADDKTPKRSKRKSTNGQAASSAAVPLLTPIEADTEADVTEAVPTIHTGKKKKGRKQPKRTPGGSLDAPSTLSETEVTPSESKNGDFAPAKVIKPILLSAPPANGFKGAVSDTSGVSTAEKEAIAEALRLTSAKKSLCFDLKRNTVHQIGNPLPPAELRTPPRAKPNGSALKKISNLPEPRSDIKPKKLEFPTSKRRKRASDFF